MYEQIKVCVMFSKLKYTLVPNVQTQVLFLGYFFNPEKEAYTRLWYLLLEVSKIVVQDHKYIGI